MLAWLASASAALMLMAWFLVADLLARPIRGPRVCSCKVAADAALQIGMGAAKGGI